MEDLPDMLALFVLLMTSLAEDTHPPDADPITIATFNVWGLPWPLAPRRRARLAAIEQWAAEGRFDVVAVQEAWRGSRGMLGSGMVYPTMDGDSGLGLRTRHPVTSLGFVPFEAQRGPDRLKTKGVWWVRISLPGGVCTFGIVHLQAGRNPKSAGVRRQQIGQILASRPPGPLVLLGDFNLHRGSTRDAASHDDLLQAGLHEARPLRDQGTSRYGTHRLDRMYVSIPSSWTHSRVRTQRHIVESDHYPLVLEIAPD